MLHEIPVVKDRLPLELEVIRGLSISRERTDHYLALRVAKYGIKFGAPTNHSSAAADHVGLTATECSSCGKRERQSAKASFLNL